MEKTRPPPYRSDAFGGAKAGALVWMDSVGVARAELRRERSELPSPGAGDRTRALRSEEPRETGKLGARERVRRCGAGSGAREPSDCERVPRGAGRSHGGSRQRAAERSGAGPRDGADAFLTRASRSRDAGPV